jgi:hypothetical protein
MKTPRSFLLHPVVWIVLLLVAPAYGQTVVHWGDSQDYITSNTNLAFTNSSTSGDFWRSGAPQNVTPLSGYSTPTDRTGGIYGVFQQETTATTKTYSSLRLFNGTTGSDFINLVGQSPSTLSGLIYFTKNEFLNGFNSGAFSLSSVEEIKLTLAADSTGTAVLRPAVLNGTDWYLSSSSSADISAGIRTFQDVGSSTWATWDPSEFPLPPAPGSFGTSSDTLTDIQAFGFYFNVQREGQARLNVSGYEVTAVPEPATVSLLLLSAAGLWAARLVKRRRS